MPLSNPLAADCEQCSLPVTIEPATTMTFAAVHSEGGWKHTDQSVCQLSAWTALSSHMLWQLPLPAMQQAPDCQHTGLEAQREIPALP